MDLASGLFGVVSGTGFSETVFSFRNCNLSPHHLINLLVIVTKIQKMHDADVNVYPFQDWGSPQGKKYYRSTLFLLPAVTGLSGGTLRIPNSFLTQVGGGHNVVFSTSILLCIPMIMAGIALQDPNCPFNLLIAAALLSGVGGGAFASSMSNSSFFYPKSLQGMALGYNGGIGNLGISISQLLAPILMSVRTTPILPEGDSPVNGWPANAGWLWFPLCAASAILAFFFMSNQPNHGEKNNLVSLVNFYWMEAFGFLASFIGVIPLIQTRNAAMLQTPAGQVIHKFLLALLACVCEYVFMMLSPQKARDRVTKTYIMTWLYIVSPSNFTLFFNFSHDYYSNILLLSLIVRCVSGLSLVIQARSLN